VIAGTVSVTWEGGRDGHWAVEVTSASGESVSYAMAAYRDVTGATWPMPDPVKRPADGDVASWDRTGPEFAALAGAVQTRAVSAQQAQAQQARAMDYGRHLFDALLAPGWAVLDSSPPAGEPLVVQLRWQPGRLHHFAWELIHDGNGYLALRSAAPVVLVRLVGSVKDKPPATITRAPRVLFAVGCALNDGKVQAGAEVMGVLREIERGTGRQGSAVVARVLPVATLTRLREACASLDPDVVHLIGHGRWDGEENVGKLTLAPEGADPQAALTAKGVEYTAAELAEAISRLPRNGASAERSMPILTVVSACDSAGTASAAIGLPLGAELAAEGVPVVIAMAGTISDTACRVFTRSVVAAAARGKDMMTALAIGRYAASAYAKGTPVKVDWALPAIFLRAPLPDGFVLADTSVTAAVRDVIEQHKDVAFPLFAGRPGLLDSLDALLRPGNPGALVLHSVYEKRVGGTRALQELAAEAVRKGHLPVRIGPFAAAKDAPVTFPQLADKIARRLITIAKGAGVQQPRRTLLLLTGHDPDLAADEPSANKLLSLPLAAQPLSADWLVDLLRADVFSLRDAIAAKQPLVFSPDAAPLLLLDDVHLYTNCQDELRDQLGASGFGAAPQSLPIVLFVKEHLEAGWKMTQSKRGDESQGHVMFHPLVHVTELTDGNDALALLSWMLHPPRGIDGWPQEILAPNESVEAVEASVWLDAFRAIMWDRDYYDPKAYREFATYVLKNHFLEVGKDDKIMKAFGMLS
jgi:hypothetical protein